MTLAQAMPREFRGGEFDNTPAFKMADVEVVASHTIGKPDWKRWPGTHRNVPFWVELANGKAVAFNENVARGWSFPVIKLPL